MSATPANASSPPRSRASSSIRQLHAELPYASAVETEKFTTRKDGIGRNPPADPGRAATPRRAIVLGKGGARIKEIGSARAPNSPKVLGRKVHLYLHVKVKPNWDEDRGVYRDMGLDWVE